MSQLKLYRASAGAGKTHTLVISYLALALQNPNNFQHILAVTFTNKATQEMKSRIINALYGLAQGLSSAVADALMCQQGWQKEDLQKRSQDVLTSLLHRYTHFSVRTIDSFFQTVIRAFAK